MGNPHAVAFVDDEATLAGLDLTRPPEHDEAVYPDGVNVELVVRRGERHVAHARPRARLGRDAVVRHRRRRRAGARSATADAAPRPATYTVDVPGGTLTLTWTEDDRVLLTGPAVVVARGTTSL